MRVQRDWIGLFSEVGPLRDLKIGDLNEASANKELFPSLSTSFFISINWQYRIYGIKV